jgi:hypothetical protein
MVAARGLELLPVHQAARTVLLAEAYSLARHMGLVERL